MRHTILAAIAASTLLAGCQLGITRTNIMERLNKDISQMRLAPTKKEVEQPSLANHSSLTYGLWPNADDKVTVIRDEQGDRFVTVFFNKGAMLGQDIWVSIKNGDCDVHDKSQCKWLSDDERKMVFDKGISYANANGGTF